MKIILASKSPARKRILEKLGISFSVVPSYIDEDQILDPIPSRRVKKLAKLKAKTVLKKAHETELVIISADTMVYMPKSKAKNLQSRFIGKPNNLTEAKQILQSLSGSIHFLYSGLCVVWRKNGIVRQFLTYAKTKMTFRKISDEEIDKYIKQENVLTFAGAYSIESNRPGVGFIKKMEGSYTNVVGLPIEKLKTILKKVKIIN
jgi:septum formation protein